jgi:2-polyprenyl-3-methyl-5-hydroxy-6-metoxy-1,4-benzoquinol methylase
MTTQASIIDNIIFKCILCNSNNFTIKNNTIRKNISQIYKILECVDCNHIQLYPNNYDVKTYYDNDQQDIECKSIQNRSDSEYSKMIIDLHLQRIKILEQHIKIDKSMKIIDIGGGKCYFANLISKKYNNIYVLEPGISRINYTDENNITKINKLLDDNFANENKNNFDVVTAIHVLEHVINPVQFLSNCYKILKPNGLLYIEVPNQDDTRIELSDYYKNNIWYCLAHISYFTQNTLKYILNKLKITNYTFDTFERYNYENYMYFLNNNRPQPICTYYNGTPSSIEEVNWIKDRNCNMTSDSISVIIRKYNEID